MSNNQLIESLERRSLLAAQINFADFSDTTSLVTNGYEGKPVTVDSKLRLTDNEFYQARSVWYDQAVPIEKFRADFSFRISKNSDGADGFTFAMINGPTSTLGADGRGLGFGAINVPSEAAAFNFFNFRKFGSQFGFASNGERPGTNTKMNPLNLHSGRVMKATLTYDGDEMKIVVVDAKDRRKAFTATQQIDLPAELETSDAIVGFTAGTGANRAEQEILSWRFEGDRAVQPAPAPAPAPALPTNPEIVTAANASPVPVRTRTTTLSVLGNDAIDGESALTYSWAATKLPNGAKTPIFSVNGTNASKDTVARFYKEGTYGFRVTITNSKTGLTSTSDVNVRVVSTGTYIGIDRHEQKVSTRGRMQFNAVMYDQFRREMKEQPTFTWSVSGDEGTGTIDAETGWFRAGRSTGHADIAASALGLTGTVGVTVIPAD